LRHADLIPWIYVLYRIETIQAAEGSYISIHRAFERNTFEQDTLFSAEKTMIAAKIN
jgi:hypothetical protein